MNVDRKRIRLTKKTLFLYKKPSAGSTKNFTADPIISAMTITGTGPGQGGPA